MVMVEYNIKRERQIDTCREEEGQRDTERELPFRYVQKGIVGWVYWNKREKEREREGGNKLETSPL